MKAQKDKEAAELAAKKEAEKLAKAPIKKQAEIWIESFSIPQTPQVLVGNIFASEIEEKFNSFKKWAKNQIENI